MQIFDAQTRTQIGEILNDMIHPITLVLFTKNNCYSCAETSQLLKEITEIKPIISLKEYDIEKNPEIAEQYDVTLTPSFVILDKDNQYKGVKFNGIPAGHEINSLISALIEMSGNEIAYKPEILNRIKRLDKPINIKVFVTLSCPHCPGAVQTAHRLAMLNTNIQSEMIEAQTFYDLSNKFKVSGVPKIIINDQYELVGNQPIEAFLETIEKNLR